jgi:uncharacterized protein YutE (UPF0331/DUF86 family)
MAAPIVAIRPAVLDESLYLALSELRAFRHLVRHRYGFDLHAERVIENLELTRRGLESFTQAIIDLERRLSQDEAEPE